MTVMDEAHARGVLASSIWELLKTKSGGQTALAAHLGVSRQAVSQWVLGATAVPSSRVPAICTYFKVTPNRLYDWPE